MWQRAMMKMTIVSDKRDDEVIDWKMSIEDPFRAMNRKKVYRWTW